MLPAGAAGTCAARWEPAELSSWAEYPSACRVGASSSVHHPLLSWMWLLTCRNYLFQRWGLNKGERERNPE
jgi:hypothetical protein